MPGQSLGLFCTCRCVSCEVEVAASCTTVPAKHLDLSGVGKREEPTAPEAWTKWLGGKV